MRSLRMFSSAAVLAAMIVWFVAARLRVLAVAAPPTPSAPAEEREAHEPVRLVHIPVVALGPRDTTTESRARRAARALRSNATALTWLAIVVAWFFTLRPVALGGPAGYNIVAGTSMLPTLQSGDLVMTSAQPAYSVGDVIAYHIPDGDPTAGAIVIHRIIGGDGVSGFETQGDNIRYRDPWHPTYRDVIGRATFYLPGAGRVFLSLKSPLVLAVTLGLLAGFWWWFSSPGPKKEEPKDGQRPRRGLVGIPIRRRALQPVPMGEPVEEPAAPAPG